MQTKVDSKTMTMEPLPLNWQPHQLSGKLLVHLGDFFNQCLGKYIKLIHSIFMIIIMMINDGD